MGAGTLKWAAESRCVMMRRMRALILAAMLAVTVAGCMSSGHSGPAHHTTAARPRSAIPAQALHVACPSAGSEAGRQAAAQPARPVPPGFVPIAVVQCPPAIVAVDGNGPRAAPAEEVAVSGLGRLVAALRAQPARIPPGVACAAQLIYVPWLVLVGRNGQVVRPKVPPDGCGEPATAVLASLSALRWIAVSTRAGTGP
jgi:hypothetical protein